MRNFALHIAESTTRDKIAAGRAHIEKAANTSFSARIQSSGVRGPRHFKKYIQPFLKGGEHAAKKDTHVMATNVGPLRAGTKVTIHKGYERDGSHYVDVSQGKHRATVKTSSLFKPQGMVRRLGDAGFGAESAIVKHLQKHGLMDKADSGAGSTGGNDFYVRHASGQKYHGKHHETLQGESKINLKAKFGAAALAHDPKKGGWHVTDKARADKPRFTKSVESATVGSVPLLKHLNKVWGDPRKGGKLSNVTTDVTDLKPLHAYNHDHNVDLMHVGTHGTFRVGRSAARDRANLGLPLPRGTGRFSVGPERSGGDVAAAFRVHNKDDAAKGTKSFAKSHIDITKDEHIKDIKRRLGYK